MASKMLASQVLVIALQYSVLLLMCFFLYRVLQITYRDFSAMDGQLPSAVRDTGMLKIIEPGLLSGKELAYPIGETLNIGRSEGNDIVINETTVSHEHACITRYQNQYLLSDLNSTNGTLHNNVRITDDTVLRRGDTIQIGKTTFQFEE